MAQPPVVPTFEKSRIPTDVTGAIRWLWGLLEDHLKRTATALNRGLTPSENLAAAWVEFEIRVGTTLPMPEIRNPLPNGKAIHGVFIGRVTAPAFPGQAVFLTGAPYMEWTTGPEGGLVVLGVTGLPPAPKVVRIRALVLAE